MADALPCSLREGRGRDLTPAVEAAWTEVYGVLATTMRDAAAAH